MKNSIIKDGRDLRPRKSFGYWSSATVHLLTLVLWLVIALKSPKAFGAEAGSFFGMHVGNDTDITKAVPVLKDLGVQWVRLWADVNWQERREHPAFQKARELKAAGFQVILLLHQRAVPEAAEVKSYCDWVQTVPGLSSKVLPFKKSEG